MKPKDFLILLIRLFLGYVFLSAGFCKLTDGHFGQLIGPPWMIEGLAKYGLALFAKVVAYSQIVCGVLLLSQRFSTLGAVMLVPMNVSILAVTISQDWVGTPYVNAVFLLMNILLLTYEWQKFRFLFKPANFMVRDNTLDRFRFNKLNLIGILFMAGAILPASTGFYVAAALIVSFGFVMFVLPLVLDEAFHPLEKLLLVQSCANMLLMTLAFKNKVVITALSLNTALLALILIGWLIFRMKKKEPVTAPESYFV